VFWTSRLFAEIVTMWHAKRLGQKYLDLTMPEASATAKASGLSLAPDGFALRCFGNAYATYAQKYGAVIEAHASESELDSDQWRIVLQEFVNEWPQIVRRFQVTDEEWRNALRRTI
jgi:hypothetical protein